jgi:two-component system CheB/CheR fusion protein
MGNIVSNLVGYDRLLDDARAVLDSLIPRELEVQTRAGLWYLLRIQPYRTRENVIEGAVINFTEITELKKAQAERKETEGLRRLAAVVRDAHDAILVQDLTGRILAWNPGAERMYGWSEAEALALNIRELVPEPKRKEALAVVRQLSRGHAMEPYCMPRITKNGQTVEVWLTATALVDGDDEMYAIATTERITDAKE